MSQPIAYTSCLRVNRVRLDVALGCEPEERANPQAVEVNVAFFFPEVTNASYKDSGDFVCYGKLSFALQKMCEGKEFRLIEYLGMEMYQVARNTTPLEVKITLTLTKCDVPVDFVHGGASFSYTDVPPFSWTPPL